MKLPLLTYAIATLLTLIMFWLAAQYIVQLINAIFGFHGPSHYHVTRIV